jgi:catechol 2,3-dioxygenase-like lactoylglutathione lyase family enzyme
LKTENSNDRQDPEMLEIEAVNHIGIRIADKSRAVAFYQLLGFEFTGDAGFEEGYPTILNLSIAAALVVETPRPR